MCALPNVAEIGTAEKDPLRQFKPATAAILKEKVIGAETSTLIASPRRLRDGDLASVSQNI
jgi:hypothetical protein